jgi:hypothetical protein
MRMPKLALADELDALASTLSRMPLASHKAPEAPHECRAEIVRAMFKLADKWRATTKEPAPAARRRRVPSAKGIHGVYTEGRYVPVVKR